VKGSPGIHRKPEVPPYDTDEVKRANLGRSRGRLHRSLP
jgi:hypothetical protein